MATIKPEHQDDWEPLESIKGILKKDHQLKEGKNDTDYYLDGQFIVTGLPADIEKVVGRAFGELEPTNRVVMKPERPQEQSQDSESESSLPRPDMPTLFPHERLEDLEIHLYEIPEESLPVGEAIDRIYRTAMQMQEEEKAIEFGVYADPNYLAGRPPRIKLSADPDCVEAGAADPPHGATDVSMESQWALGPEGIKLFDETESGLVRCTDRMGQGIRVGIFDTSPYRNQGKKTNTRIKPELVLYVSHPGEVVPLKSHGSAPNIRDHGLFVAGLVHVVAPESEIHLIRVLNGKNQGDLDTLVNALQLFTNRMMDVGGRLNGTVINLSLGVHLPRSLRAAGLEGLEKRVQEVSLRNTGGYQPSTDGSVTIASLYITLLSAYRKGAVIVAAAGNDSRDPPEVKPTQIPASYPFVIGVAGSNFCGDRACFSNRGDVAAPSGDVGRAGKKTVLNCNRWPGFCLTSLAKKFEPRTGFAHWIGTSFATPLVSGQAALLLEDMGMSPDRVRMAIEETAVEPTPPDPDLGAGVISLPESLLF
jgi:hypothetical protein